MLQLIVWAERSGRGDESLPHRLCFGTRFGASNSRAFSIRFPDRTGGIIKGFRFQVANNQRN